MMTEEEYATRTIAQIKAAYAHRPVPMHPGKSAALWFKGRVAADLTADDWHGREHALHDFSVEAFCYYLQSVLRVAITDEGFPPLVRGLLDRLDGTHNLHFHHLHHLTRPELNAIRHCLHLLSYRPEIGDDPVRQPMRTVIRTRPTVH